MKYDFCELQAEQQKKHGLANSHLQCATMGTAQHQRDGGRSLVSTATLMMFAVELWVIMSWMNDRSPNFGVFAILNESNHSWLCWLNFLCAELQEDDPVWLVGTIPTLSQTKVPWWFLHFFTLFLPLLVNMKDDDVHAEHDNNAEHDNSADETTHWKGQGQRWWQHDKKDNKIKMTRRTTRLRDDKIIRWWDYDED